METKIRERAREFWQKKQDGWMPQNSTDLISMMTEFAVSEAQRTEVMLSGELPTSYFQRAMKTIAGTW